MSYYHNKYEFVCATGGGTQTHALREVSCGMYDVDVPPRGLVLSATLCCGSAVTSAAARSRRVVLVLAARAGRS